MNKDIIVVPDTQVHGDVPLTHIVKLAKYIWKHKPEHIVHIGDAFDFPSLCSYNTSEKQEGLRLIDDITAGAFALAIIPEHIKYKNRKNKKKAYRPKLEFITGNHERRIQKIEEQQPHFKGMFQIDGIISDIGWNVHPFLEPHWINGIAFNHYMQNPHTGNPIGGGIENKLNKHHHSFVHGHQQQFQYGRRQTLDGKPHFGVCAGAFYMHDEDYRGANNTEVRGFVHMHHFINRYGFDDYDVEFVSLERLLNDKL